MQPAQVVDPNVINLERCTMSERKCRLDPEVFASFHAHLVRIRYKLQALIYDILPSTTAVFSYAIGSRKLSGNVQFFVGAQTVVGMLQTTQIKQDVSFIAANIVYTSTNKTSIV